ncbi:conserved oligomeric Golgi complex subunit 8 [Plakobranchus ocellatus]|uniref:Conserved oligomeric Golgi complex subunit 8 n=1 Tax=Plakobranchus ocellatus TaxID=259542 RepID=A0AAV4DR17_9GAST|nr:conserved oligomeric Golgi complex subunit 8 [Plakobranchus ocellatus]
MAAEIDVEDENILTAIFKDSFPESWQDNPDFVQYLVELSSHGAERLSGEPDRLQEEKAQILAETQDLAFHNYSTFIQTADCSKEIFQDFQIIEKHLENLVNKLPNFSEECNKVILKAQEISSSRRMNSLTLQRHTQLLEVLEMPQLMDTCVRNGYYEEALELAAHVKRLEKKHPNIPVIMGIVKEVKWSTQLMLNQLIQQLRTNLQLPACLRVIGFLRRMDVFTEAELRIKFLQARDSWFQGILDAIPTGDAYTHITKTVEASRVHLFDIMTQFRAIFSDEDPLVSTGRQDDAINETLLFHSWVLQKISQFLATLERDLEEGVGGRLDSILGQCMYFGLSFSRVGADFRGLLAPIFERTALHYFEAALAEANKKFEENMQSYNLLGFTTTGGLPFGVTSSQSGQLYPPTTLLDFYPLAAYCNHVLTAFNDLRLCSPLNLALEVPASLDRSLQEVNRVILAFFRAEETTFNQAEKEQFEHFCATYATDLLPYLSRCVQALFPPQQLAKALGLSLTEVHKKGGLGQLDVPSIIAPVQHLMPAPVTASSSISPEESFGEAEEASGPVKFTLDSDSDDTQRGSEQPQNSSETPAETSAETNVEQESYSSSVNPSNAMPSADSGVASVVAGESEGLTDSGVGGSGSTAPDLAYSADLQATSPASTDVEESETASSSEAVPAAPTGVDTAAKTDKPQGQPALEAPSSLSVDRTAPEPDSIGGSDGLNMTEQGGEGGGGWEGLDDLGDLDALNLDGAESTVDLDLLPTPSGSEADLAQRSDKQD